MADEGGFEVARAYVTVSPDAADFAEQLQEQVGGITVTVNVDANTTPANDQIDELQARAEGLQGSYDMNFGAATGQASSAIDELGAQIDDLTGRVSELQIGANAGESSETIQSLNAEMDALAQTMAKLEAESEAVSASLSEVAVTGEEASGALAGSAGSIDELIAEFTALSAEFRDYSDVAGSAIPETQALGAGFTELAGALAAARASGAATSAEIAALQAQLLSLGGELDVLESSFGTSVSGLRDLGTAAGETVGELDALGTAGEQAANFAGLWQTQYAGVASELENAASDARNASAAFEVSGEDIAALGAEFNVAATELGQLAVRIGDMTPEVGELQGVASALGGDLEAMGTEAGTSAAQFAEMQGRVAALGGALDSLEADVPQITADFNALGDAVEIEGLHSAAGMYENTAAQIDAMGSSADAAAGKVGNLGDSGGHAFGMFHLLSNVISEIATSPWTWVAVAGAAVLGLGVYLDQTDSAVQKLSDTWAQQDKATGVNLAGYQKLQGQLDAVTASTSNYAQTLESAGQAGKPLAHNLAGALEIMPELTAAQQQAATSTDNLAGHLAGLELRYGLSQTQAEELASAAKVQAGALTGSGAAASAAMQKIQAYAEANIGARGAVGEMSNDMNIFGNDALTASTRVNALNDAFDLLVGNFVASKQLQLQVASDFLTIASNAQQTGASMRGTNQASNTLQQSFFAIIPDIENTADAMTKQGDSAQQVTGYINDQIGKLSGLTGGNQAAQQAVEGLRQWEDNLKLSTDGANSALQQASQTLENQFTKQVENAGLNSKVAKGDITDLSTAIENTGTKSTATHDARQQLITDLETSGVSAKTATKLVDNYITSLGRIPRNVSTTLTYTAKGTWSVSGGDTYGGTRPGATGGGAPGIPGAAIGGLITGGVQGRDSVPILAMPGEVVVPARMVNAGLVDHLRGKLPGFQGGGVVGAYSGPVSGAGQWAYSDWSAQNQVVETTLENAVMGAVGSAEQQAAGAAATNNVTVIFNGTQYPNSEQLQSMTLHLTSALSNA